VALNTSTFKGPVTFQSNKEETVNFTNDISCKAYDGENAVPRQCPNTTTQNSPNTTTQNNPNTTTQNSPNTTTQNNPNTTTQNSPNTTTQNSLNTTTRNSPNTTTQNNPLPAEKLEGSTEDGNPRDKGENTCYARAY
jgi:hypothetical protein